MRINQHIQILHIDDFCNECGNCETFCPHEGKPFRDKLTLFSGKEMFEKSQNSGFYLKSSLDEDGYRYRCRCRIHDLIFEAVIDNSKHEVAFVADEFSILFNKRKKGDGLSLMEYSTTGTDELDTQAMVGLYFIIEIVLSLSPYLLNREEEQ